MIATSKPSNRNHLAHRIGNLEFNRKRVTKFKSFLMRAETSIPIAAIQAAVLYRFRQVLGRNRFRAAEIGDSACHFEYPVMRACAQAHAADRDFERTFAGFVERAQLA